MLHIDYRPKTNDIRELRDRYECSVFEAVEALQMTMGDVDEVIKYMDTKRYYRIGSHHTPRDADIRALDKRIAALESSLLTLMMGEQQVASPKSVIQEVLEEIHAERELMRQNSDAYLQLQDMELGVARLTDALVPVAEEILDQQMESCKRQTRSAESWATHRYAFEVIQSAFKRFGLELKRRDDPPGREWMRQGNHHE